MQGKISLGEIIARGNKDGANGFVTKYGYPPTNSVGNLAFAINRILLTRGEVVLPELMEIHPDREMLMEHAGEKHEQHHNCCGHHNATGKGHTANMSAVSRHCNCSGAYNAEGSGNNQHHLTDTFGKQAFYIILGISAIFGLVLLARQDKQRA